eukprot:9142170-Prorocentrum_lima.AAC.1
MFRGLSAQMIERMSRRMTWCANSSVCAKTTLSRIWSVCTASSSERGTANNRDKMRLWVQYLLSYQSLSS